MISMNNRVVVEFVAGLSTFLTMSYIFLLNPVLLAKIPDINITGVFGATVLTAVVSTLFMGLWAKVPFAAAPVPSITTFFVGYVVLTLGMGFEQALAAVFVSGVLSVLMTYLSIRQKLLNSVSPFVSYGVLAALCGFLLAVGLKQAGLVEYKDGIIAGFLLDGKGVAIMLTGILVTYFMARFNVPAPLIGILAASIVAAYYGEKSVSKADFSLDLFSYVWAIDFKSMARVFYDIDFFIAVLVFFVIDFFAGVGKYIGLFQAIKNNSGDEAPLFESPESKKRLGRSLYADGLGNMIGSTLGAGSVAVFVSSAVGVGAGGRTGLTAVFVALLMVASIAFIPLVGIVPTIAVSGILVYIGFLLVPFGKIRAEIDKGVCGKIEVTLCFGAALLALVTFSLDMAIALVFSVNSVLLLIRPDHRFQEHAIFHVSSILLVTAIIYKYVA